MYLLYSIFMNLTWIFFDIGGVLSDESRYTEWRIGNDLAALHLVNPSITREDILEVWNQASGTMGQLDENIIRLLTQGSDVEKVIAAMRKGKQGALSYEEQQSIRPEAKDVLHYLASKYHLGIIANQGPKIREKMAEAGILSYFEHAGVSGDYDLSKPDPRYFQRVLEEVGAQAETSAIVDDNIERSLVPAKKLGFTTVWYQLQERSVPRRVVDETVRSLGELKRFL